MTRSPARVTPAQTPHRRAAKPSISGGERTLGRGHRDGPGKRARSRGSAGTARPPLSLHHSPRQWRLPECAETFPARRPHPGFPPVPSGRRFPPRPSLRPAGRRRGRAYARPAGRRREGLGPARRRRALTWAHGLETHGLPEVPHHG